jgi:3',5'-nucleoside bisphosphate phosphatase
VRWYKADLHIHTILSACAELSMGPKDIVQAALAHGLDIIAVTDHNSAENVAAVMGAAEQTPLLVIAGMEVYTREEAHMICLFEKLSDALDFQEVIYEHLPEGSYDGDLFGEQYICDKDEHILGESQRFLSFPLNLPVHIVAGFVIDLGGIIYPAHIDRKSNSLLHSLGFLPNNLPLPAVEIARPYTEAIQQLGFLTKSSYSIIRSSDAHDIGQIGEKYTFFKLNELSFNELKMAIEKRDGRFASLQVEEAYA